MVVSLFIQREITRPSRSAVAHISHLHSVPAVPSGENQSPWMAAAVESDSFCGRKKLLRIGSESIIKIANDKPPLSHIPCFRGLRARADLPSWTDRVCSPPSCSAWPLRPQVPSAGLPGVLLPPQPPPPPLPQCGAGGGGAGGGSLDGNKAQVICRADVGASL